MLYRAARHALSRASAGARSGPVEANPSEPPRAPRAPAPRAGSARRAPRGAPSSPAPASGPESATKTPPFEPTADPSCLPLQHVQHPRRLASPSPTHRLASGDHQSPSLQQLPEQPASPPDCEHSPAECPPRPPPALSKIWPPRKPACRPPPRLSAATPPTAQPSLPSRRQDCLDDMVRWEHHAHSFHRHNVWPPHRKRRPTPCVWHCGTYTQAPGCEKGKRTCMATAPLQGAPCTGLGARGIAWPASPMDRLHPCVQIGAMIVFCCCCCCSRCRLRTSSQSPLGPRAALQRSLRARHCRAQDQHRLLPHHFAPPAASRRRSCARTRALDMKQVEGVAPACQRTSLLHLR
mmetsp:Transcript_14853/g.42605  ORF Transcript_14853/g.42605 Transcript_14853/m.42605 type:complete len:350 (-) Transcript_14853:53-1102(-)